MENVDMTNSKVLNMASAFEITDGSRELFCQIMDLFIEMAPEQLKRIKIAYNNKDMKELSASAHDVKSSASSFGGDILFHSALNLEQQAKKGLDLGEISLIIEDVETGIQSVIEAYCSKVWEPVFKEVK
jgi:HPt (histidine-containing phosphotransfer) domain-containing protein